MKKILTIISLAILSLTIACSNGQQQNNEGKKIKIAYIPITHALPLFAAVELPENQRENKNVELVKFSSWPELVEALNAGKVDGASILVQLALKSQTAGHPLKAVALGHRDGNVVVVNNEIENASQLDGKTVAIPHRMSSHNILLQQVLKNNGIDPANIKITELPPPEMPAAIASNQIQSYVVAEPFGAKSVVAKHSHVLYQSNDLWENSICCALVINTKAVEDKQDEIKAFVKDYLKAGNQLDTKNVETLNLAKKYLKVNEDVLKQSLEWINYQNLTISEADYNLLIEKVKEFNILDNPPSYSDFVLNY